MDRQLIRALALTLALLAPVCASAGSVAMMAGGGVPSGAATDSCTGALTFSWHMENVNVTLGGIVGGVNNGCSVGDTTATAVSSVEINGTQEQDGVASLYVPGALDRYSFDIASDDLVNPNAGTVIFYVYFVSGWTSASHLWEAGAVSIDTSNRIFIEARGTDDATGREIRLTHIAGATTRNLTTTAADMAIDTWYKVTAKWDTTVHGADYFYLSVDDANAVTGTSAPGTWAGTNAVMDIGNYSGNAMVFFMDNIKVYNAWQ